MSRLDDIIARNQRALGGDHGIVKLAGKLASKPGKATTSPALVIAVMLGLGAAVGWFAYKGMQAEDDRRAQLQRQP